ncbi:MAG TPA: hypothetical protein VNI20_09050 [Fimbriimonadaceae bacterium]|nr:hypothetical protein [Fimbriimonadaceae bacterium]
MLRNRGLSQRALTALAVVATLAPFAMAGNVQGAVQSTVDGKRVTGAVVYIASVPGKFKAPEKPVLMDQKDKTFVPDTLAIMVGTTVRFLNSDPFLHNVYANSRLFKFNISQPDKGKYSDVTFDKFGVVAVRCHIHAAMKGYIAVLDNPFFAVTDKSGLFKIPDVPAGSYTLKVWTPTGSTDESITVGATGNTTILLKVKT